MALVHGRSLGQILQTLGLLPDNTADVEILTPAHGAIQIRFTVYLTRDQLGLLAQAFQQLAEEGRHE